MIHANVIHANVFVDLDGVLAKFKLGFYDQFELVWEKVPYRNRWELIASHPNFFGSLKRGCSDLILGMNRIYGEHNVHVLASCPELGFEQYSNQKFNWVRKKVPELKGLILFSRGGTRKTCFMQNKKDILLDDKDYNLAAWKAAGGLAIKVKYEDYTTFSSFWPN